MKKIVYLKYGYHQILKSFLVVTASIFSLAVSAAPPKNDTKEFAIAMSIKGSCGKLAEYSNKSATDDGISDCSGRRAMASNVWFSFKANGSYVKLDVATGGSEGTIVSPQLALFDESGNEISCVKTKTREDISMIVNNLVASQVYYLSVFNESSGASNQGTFTLCSTSVKFNDEIPDAIELLDTKDWCSEPSAYSNIGATENGNSSACSPRGSDVWFRFKARTSYVRIRLMKGNSNGTILSPGLSIWDSNSIELTCATGNSGANSLQIEQKNLTVDGWYYVSVSSAKETEQGTFRLCVNDCFIPQSLNVTATGSCYYPNGQVTTEGSEKGVNYFLNGVSQPGTGSNLIWDNIGAGDYTLSASGTSECFPVWIADVHVPMIGDLESFMVGGGGTYCSKEAGLLNVTLSSSQSNATYQLKFNGVNLGEPIVGTSSALLWSKLSKVGIYTVVATPVDGGCGQLMKGNVEILQGVIPTAYEVGGGGAYCAESNALGVSVTLNGSEIDVMYQLKVDGMNAPNTREIMGTGEMLTWPKQTAIGLYTVTATNQISGCEREMDFKVLVKTNSLPTIYTLQGGGVVCRISDPPKILLSGSQKNILYQLYQDRIVVGDSIVGTGEQLSWLNQPIGKDYTVTAKNKDTGCQSMMNGRVSIEKNPDILIAEVSGGGVRCSDAPGIDIMLSASQVDAKYSLVSQDGVTVGEPLIGIGDALIWPGITEQGIYTIIATHSNCTLPMNGSAQIKVFRQPTVFEVSGGGPICDGAGGTVTLSGSQSGMQYQLMLDGGDIGPSLSGNNNAISWSGLTSGNYTVKATNAEFACQSIMTGAALISVIPLPQPFNVTSGDLNVCLNEAFPIILASSESDVTYQLQKDGQSLLSAKSGTGTALNWTVKAQQGTYTIIAARQICTMTMNGSIVPTIIPLPQQYTFTGGGAVYDKSPSIKLTLHGSQSGVEYTLLKNGVAVSPPIAGTGKNLFWTDQRELGTYRVKAVNTTTGCEQLMTGQGFITNQILPQEVKITRAGVLTVPPVERKYRLDSIQLDRIIDVFKAPPCLEGKYYAGFQLYYDLGNRETVQQWTSQLSLTLLHGEDSVLTLPLLVNTTDQTFVSTAFFDSLVSCTDDYRIAIREKKNVGNVPEANIHLKILLYRKDALPFNPVTTLSLNCSPIGNKTSLSWTCPDNAASEFDIEWVFISQEEKEKFTGTSALDAFQFKEPVRVTVTGANYKHINYYPTGTLWYRARAVGYNPLYPTHRIQGEWSYSPCESISVTNPEVDMNWQEQTVFAEDGKYKKIVSYFDGTMRQRQIQTNLSTEDISLIGESLYDFEGRPSVQVLPVPGQDNTLTYKANFNSFVSTDQLVLDNTTDGKTKFHYDNRRVANSKLSAQNGAEKYYSSNNTHTDIIHRDYIPQAQGYPYTQTEYTNDGTGRVSRQSGVGPVFRQDGDHTTRTYYGTVAQAELVRLFGSNVGNASHYHKTMVVDANNQVNVRYVDQEGRTIATALAGDSPSNVDSLESLKLLDPTPITVDISSRNVKDNGAWSINHTILNEASNTLYTFRYDMAALASEVETFGCKECVFDLEIKLTDPEGMPLSFASVSGNESPDTLRYLRKGITAVCGPDSTKVNDINFAVYLKDIGDYTLTKTLSAHELTFDQMQAIVGQEQGVQSQIAQIQNTYAADPSQCAICSELCPEAEQAIEEAMQEVAEQDCENLLHQIIAELKAPYEESNPDYEPTQAQIEAHATYCQYVLCKKNIPSDVFDMELTRYGSWTAAITAGNSNPILQDPFFNNAALSGVTEKNKMQGRLDDVFVGNVGFDNNNDGEMDGTDSYYGSIDEVTDPTNTDFYIDNNGNRDVNGFHLLYATIMAERSVLGETEYQKQIDEQRWTLYRNFYVEAKRKIKLDIPAYKACPAMLAQLGVQDELPKTPEDMEQWAAQQPSTLVNEVSQAELKMALHNIRSSCNSTFTEMDSTDISDHLQMYFNSNKKNFFRMIIKTDLTPLGGATPNSHLLAIQDILGRYNCSLDSIALENPFVCAQDTTVTIPPQLISQADPRVSSGQSLMRARSMSLNSASTSEMDSTQIKLKQLRNEQKEQLKQEIRSGFASKNASRSMSKTLATTLVAKIPPQDVYDALVEFYNSTNGPNWENTVQGIKPWNAVAGPARDISNWYGIEADNSGHVYEIDLSENGLSGEVPESFGILDLYGLDLASNQLTKLPDSFGNLVNLQYLYLTDNLFTGSFPTATAPMVGLRTFVIDYNQFSGRLSPEWIVPFTTDYVYLVGNKFTFSDLQDINYSSDIGSFNYAPQDSVDVKKKVIPLLVGQSITLTTNVDRQTTTPSTYQWFKYVDGVNDLPLNTKSASAHTYTIASSSLSDVGKYYYTIDNNDQYNTPPYGNLTLISHMQTVKVPPQPQTYNICLAYDDNNPTLQKLNYTVDWNKEIMQCMQREAVADSILSQMAVQKLVEQHISNFYKKFSTQCLQRVTEKMAYTYVSKEYHYTLYYYDQGANLVQTVPPVGVHPLSPGQVSDFLKGIKTEPPHTLLTNYSYSSINQLIAQRSPDAGDSKFWFNEKGQMRLSQNAQQNLDVKYSYIKYDKQGRIIEVGELGTGQPLNSLLDSLNSQNFPYIGISDYQLADITKTHYDFADDKMENRFPQEHLRSRVAWVEILDKEAVDTIKTHYTYDVHGQVQALLQNIPGLQSKRTDYVYDQVSGKVNYVFYQHGMPDQFMHRYSYDGDNRITQVQTSSDGFLWNKEADYTYNLHGPLARTELGHYRVQGLDYYYTLLGWIKGVNMPYTGDPGQDGVNGNNTGKDVFAYSLGYFENDYTPIGADLTLSDSRDHLWQRSLENTRHTGLYNGNISWMTTDLPIIGHKKGDPLKSMQSMLYRYDQLHRITMSRSLTDYTEADGFTVRNTTKSYDEGYSYDANGNILTLKRNDELAILKDDFNYDYYANSNKLKNIKSSQVQNYIYDAIGNLVSDVEQGVRINWTPYGKVRSVHKGDSIHTTYRYDASGNRVEKKIVVGDSIVVTNYLRDVGGNVMSIYSDTVATETPIYGSSRLGQYRGGVMEGYRTLGNRSYELSNHLGNVLAVITDNAGMKQDSVWSTVASTSDYYPFGLNMEGRNFSDTTTSSYRYGFNGKEKDSFNSMVYDYGFRIYNPEIGKFLSVDPLTKSYPWYTPYQFAGNKPIWAIDLDGLEELIQPFETREFLPILKAPTKTEALSNALNDALIFFPEVAVEVLNDGIGFINFSYGVVNGTTPNVTGGELVLHAEIATRKEIKRVSKLSGGEVLGEFKEVATDLNTYKNATKLYLFTKIPGPKTGGTISKGLSVSSKNVAEAFLKGSEVSNIERHMSAIHFEHAVSVETLQEGSVLYRYSEIGTTQPKHYFFLDTETLPGELGIMDKMYKDPSKFALEKFTLQKPVKALRSTIDLGGQPGTTQIFSTQIESASKIETIKNF